MKINNEQLDEWDNQNKRDLVKDHFMYQVQSFKKIERLIQTLREMRAFMQTQHGVVLWHLKNGTTHTEEDLKKFDERYREFIGN